MNVKKSITSGSPVFLDDCVHDQSGYVLSMRGSDSAELTELAAPCHPAFASSAVSSPV